MKAMVLKSMQKTSTCDNIGNRTSSEDSGQTTEYVANELNQYTSVTSATLRELSYDADGNMLTNGEWTYAWNGENRMVLASNASHVITFAYDFQGRCYEKVKDGTTNSYVWDDFNIITEISSAHTNQNVWGLDLSGDLQGAGGVGGLLATAQDGAIYVTAFDANGNICQYVNASGTTVANREYSPFGKTVALTGSKKDDFTHWFSTKPWDADAEMSEYEYRKYLPKLGRWPSRDPIGQMGAEPWLRNKTQWAERRRSATRRLQMAYAMRGKVRGVSGYVCASCYSIVDIGTFLEELDGEIQYAHDVLNGTYLDKLGYSNLYRGMSNNAICDYDVCGLISKWECRAGGVICCVACAALFWECPPAAAGCCGICYLAASACEDAAK